MLICASYQMISGAMHNINIFLRVFSAKCILTALTLLQSDKIAFNPAKHKVSHFASFIRLFVRSQIFVARKKDFLQPDPLPITIQFWNLSVLLTAWLSDRFRRHRFDPWVGKIPWRRKWQPTPVFLPENSHGQKSLEGYSPWCCKESGTIEQLSMHTLSPPPSRQPTLVTELRIEEREGK